MTNNERRLLDLAMLWQRSGDRRYMSCTQGNEHGFEKHSKVVIKCHDKVHYESVILKEDFYGTVKDIDNLLCQSHVDSLDNSIKSLVEARQAASESC